MPDAVPSPPISAGPGNPLARRIGLFDATTAVVGGIVGAGIFMNPSVVARIVPTPTLILAAWFLGGVVALLGAWIYAELGSARPVTGGQYAYFRDAFHPCVAFLYGWGLLWVIQSGGMAAVAVTFARYAIILTGWTGYERSLAVGALAFLTFVNCFGVRAGAATQSLFTVLKALAIAALVVCGFLGTAPDPSVALQATAPETAGIGWAEFGAAMVPVLFAYGGWQTACFLAGEVRAPERTLPRALVLGIAAVITLYLAVNVVCLRTLGPAGLAATSTPASDVMSRALGPAGERFLAAGIVVSTFGFLSQGMLTTPRVYFAMARDGLFFPALGRVHATSHAPVAAILLQGSVAALIACSGRYEAILNYVVSVDFIFYGLVGVCVFVFRRRGESHAPFRIPAHPWTTLFFIGICWIIVANLTWKQPADSLKGLGILLAGIPIYFVWKRLRPSPTP
ncbi:MAG: APC family permease [Limisphaerales bacterium]